MHYFPIGYQLPESDDDLQWMKIACLGVLASFMKEDRVMNLPNLSYKLLISPNKCIFENYPEII